MLKFSNKKVIEVGDWDNLVETTYNRTYSFQQQDGCQNRGVVNITIPAPDNDEEMNDSIPEVVNGNEMGVKFKVWLARDPKQPLKDDENHSWSLGLFYERNFYPELQTVANDLHSKGLIEAGEYSININW